MFLTVRRFFYHLGDSSAEVKAKGLLQSAKSSPAWCFDFNNIFVVSREAYFSLKLDILIVSF